jgi:hypothetical protein
MEIFTNVATYEKAMRDQNINTELLPLSQLKNSRLQEVKSHTKTPSLKILGSRNSRNAGKSDRQTRQISPKKRARHRQSKNLKKSPLTLKRQTLSTKK